MKNSVTYRMLTDEQCLEIEEATYRVLERTGCIIHNKEAREILKQAGCFVEDELVKIPVEVTKKAIESAPSEVKLYTRDGKVAMDLKTGNVYFGPAITITQIDDFELGIRRASVKQDCSNAAILMDSLDNISWVSSCVSASDVDASITDIAELHAVLPNTNKPIMYWSQNCRNLEYQFKMFEAVATSEKDMQEKPFMINLICPMDPLTHTDDGMAQIIYLAKKKSPIVYIAGIGFGLSGPITLAGGITVGIADTLVGLIVSQLVNPGTPFVVSKFNDNVDMRNMSVTHSNPEMIVALSATADIFRHMGLPFCSNFGGTDNGVLDQISTFDKSVQLYTALLSGTNMNFALSAYQSGAYAKLSDLVMANEMIGFLKILTDGMEVSKETIAEDVIDEVGPGGMYFYEEHTLDHIHDFWQADLMKPQKRDEWEKAGKPNLEDALNERIRTVLAEGTKHPLEPEIIHKLDEIMNDAKTQN